MSGCKIGAAARPVFQARADRIAPLVVFGGAGGVFDARQLQRLPEITDKPAGSQPKLVIQRIDLMPVQQVKTSPADRVFENQRFCGGRQEAVRRSRGGTESGTAFDAVMIAPEQEQPPVGCKIRKLCEDVAVDLGNVRNPAIFP